MELRIALLGFGNVGRALAELLLRKADTLQQAFDLHIKAVGISTGRHGHLIDPNGIDLRAALEAVRAGRSLDTLGKGKALSDTVSFFSECPADLLFETSPTNVENGEPALGYIYGALEKGVHVATANKGPVAFGYHELAALAERKNVGFFFESTVMDGAPVFATFREGLPGATITRMRGIFNSTTNYILTAMEADNVPFGQALKVAQEIGIAETDPTQDIDGWDSAIKTVILANVLMGARLTPQDVRPKGIRSIDSKEVEEAIAAGKRIRLICEIARGDDGIVTASVAPQAIPVSDLLASVTGTSGTIAIETDTLRRLTIVEHDPGPDTTAYGLFADMLNLLRKRHKTEFGL